MKKYLFALVAMLTVSCAIALPKGAIKEGTLVNQTLVNDVSLAAATQASAQGCDKPQDIKVLVTQMPKQQGDSTTWREIWEIRCNNGTYPVKMSFIAQKGVPGVSFSASN